MRIKFTAAEDDFLRNNISKCHDLYELAEWFNAEFPSHQTTGSNMRHRLCLLGLRKGTRKKRQDKVWHINEVGHVIANKSGKQARVKTENGYVPANKYFLEKYFGKSQDTHMIVNLNGDKSDFSRDNIECVTKSVYSSMCWRSWFFTDAELTKTAILTATLLEFFSDLRHNENQYFKMRNAWEV